MAKIQKWGFGMAPIKKETMYNYKKSMHVVCCYISDERIHSIDDVVECISTLKGVFNRIRREDQWDWFIVNIHFDFPNINIINGIVESLQRLRKGILENDEIIKEKNKERLNKFGLIELCQTFRDYSNSMSDDKNMQYLYILSRREEKEVLKIGRTSRDIEKRVKEINSSTGVLHPFSPRKVYKCRDSIITEKLVHKALEDYRIRSDREFFQLKFGIAKIIIEDILIENDLMC